MIVYISDKYEVITISNEVDRHALMEINIKGFTPVLQYQPVPFQIIADKIHGDIVAVLE